MNAGQPKGNSATESTDVVVVGAGFAGLYMVHRLREAGLAVIGIEAGSDVGGTWYWNRYPGARCDIPSLLYSYTWSDALRAEWQWSEKYATQPEILAYANRAADLHDLRRHFRFDTRVVAADWDGGTGRWNVRTDRGDTVFAQHVVMATGCLSVPKEPDFEGVADFGGESYVTGRWPHEGVDFSGKRVAVIGTGSSAIQSIPLIAAQAREVVVFQRTPNFSLPAKNCPISDEERAAFEAGFPEFKAAVEAGTPGFELPPEGWEPSEEELRQLVEGLWNGGGLISAVMIPNLTRDERINEAASQFVRDRIAEIVNDPQKAAALTPRGYPFGTKRPCVDTDYFETFNQDHVQLVDLRDTPIERITPSGVQTSAGEHAVDVIVYALGFDAMTGALERIAIRGRDGRLLRDAWAEGPRTLYGLMVAGFPNLYTVTGPGSPSVLMNVITAGEWHVDWIARTITGLRDRQVRTIEATAAAQDEWVAHVNDEADQTLYPRAASWYIGANIPGKPRVFLPYVGRDYKPRIDAVAADGWPGFALDGREVPAAEGVAAPVAATDRQAIPATAG